MSRAELLELLKKSADKALAKPAEERTYEDRFHIWEHERYANPVKYLQDFSEGEEIEIYDGEKLSNNEIKDGFGNDFPEWFRNAGKHFGEKVKMDDNNEYILLGMSYTYLDYYYIVQNKDGKKCGWSCVGGIEFLEK